MSSSKSSQKRPLKTKTQLAVKNSATKQDLYNQSDINQKSQLLKNQLTTESLMPTTLPVVPIISTPEEKEKEKEDDMTGKEESKEEKNEEIITREEQEEEEEEEEQEQEQEEEGEEEKIEKLPAPRLAPIGSPPIMTTPLPIKSTTIQKTSQPITSPKISNSKRPVSIAPPSPRIPSRFSQLINMSTKDKPEQPLTFSTNEGVLTDDHLEQELATYGYMSVDKIIIKDGEDESIRYLKVINNHGQKFLIELNVDGYYLSILPTDIVVETSKTAEIIPYSIKVGSYECAKLNVCGVALECRSEICILSRTNDLTPLEERFTIYLDTPYQKGQFDDSPIVYPIVKLTEVKNNHSIVDDNIDLVMSRIRRSEYSQCEGDIKGLSVVMRSTMNNLNTFMESKESAFKRLSSTLDDLDNLIKEHEEIIANGNMTSENYNNYHLLRLIIRRRYELYDQLLRTCRQISKYKQQINTLNVLIEESNKLVNTNPKYKNPGDIDDEIRKK